MPGITREPDGSYRWDCPIEVDYHRAAGRKGLWGVLVVCAAVLVAFFIACGGSLRDDLWIPLLVIGVILAIALPLLFLWNSASDPREQYVLTGDFVKSGYGRSAVFSTFKEIREAAFTERYIELYGKHGQNRIYVPSGDMAFVRAFIRERLPEDAVIRSE